MRPAPVVSAATAGTTRAWRAARGRSFATACCAGSCPGARRRRWSGSGARTGACAAAGIGLERSTGCMRADGFARQPIVRMTNVNLEPGDAGSLEDLIAATDDGIYMETNKSWSIDQRRLHFQFGTEIAWEIEDGRRTRMLRNPTYAGVTPQFWAGLDAVCSRPAWKLWGVVNCGKGEPGQAMHVSHGAAPARFRNVQVGIA